MTKSSESAWGPLRIELSPETKEAWKPVVISEATKKAWMPIELDHYSPLYGFFPEGSGRDPRLSQAIGARALSMPSETEA